MTAAAQPDFKRWGIETLDRVQADLYLPDKHLYGEDSTPRQHPIHVSFNWGVGVMLSALNDAARVDLAYKKRLADYIEATRSYVNPAPPTPGYDVLPGPKKADRYYDDNEWMVLDLVDASEILKSKKVLGYAEQAFKFVQSGEDDQLGGGIFWREQKRNSKNTCSNGPAAAAAIALYRKTKSRSYLEEAKRIYEWTNAHLRDPADGLYWDSINLNGRVNETKWSYNTGLMLRSAAELYDLTKDEKFAKDAREIQSASLKRWVSPEGALMDGGLFMHLLLENWIRASRLVPNVEDPRSAIVTGLTYLHDHRKDPLGHYTDKWDGPDSTQPFSKFSLIAQASVARAYFEASGFLSK